MGMDSDGTVTDPRPFFIVRRSYDDTGHRWAYIDRCPHGEDLGAICFGPFAIDDRTPADPHWDRITWQFEDIGFGRCHIRPSILAKGVHAGKDCHFGPGDFDFMWLEDGETRNTEPFASRYRKRTGRDPP